MTDSFQPGPAPPAPGAAVEKADPILDRLRRATLGEYEIYSELGRGGMATVYLAHELALDRKVAIKVMSPALTVGADLVERFKREARTAAHLSHPGIIPIYSVREADGLLFFVMKLVEGTPLDSVIRELGKLPVPMVEAILTQVGGAFGYAHRRGVIHRDIKPSNILIDEEGWAMVTDFGIAKVQDSEGVTQTGTAIGTPTYMSPEQCSGGPIGGASDQYSLGVLAYEMLTGTPPFGGPMMALMYSHFHDAVPPLDTARPDCPPELARAVMRMLEKDPAARFPSMEDAVAGLGARQLPHDDPTRTQLILLARSGVSHRIVSQIQTPRSPVPLGRKQTRATKPVPASGARRLRAGVVAGFLVLVVGAGLVLRQRAGPGPEPATRAEVTPPATPATPSADGSEGVPPVAVRRPPPAPPPAPASPRVVERPPSGLGGAVVGESVAPPPVLPAPAPPAPSPAVPAPAAAPVPTPPPPAPPPADPSSDVVGVIESYARALEAGDLSRALRIYPGMPREQRQGLEAFWKVGGTMRTRWTVSEVAITGEVATARVQGINRVETPREGASEQRVNLRARLERRGPAGEWRLVALVN